jgi:hypothetical protein
MNKNSFLKITISSLIGLLIGGAALTSGVWVLRTIGPSLTAIDLWLGLRTSLNSPEILSNTWRQQEIYNWLSIIIGCFILQVITTILILNWRKVIGWGISLILWIVILLATGILMISYHAVVSGVMWLAFGCILALIGELWVILNEISFSRHDHLKELATVAQRWAKIIHKAQEQKKNFSILAIQTNPPVSFEELQKMQIELRGQDQIYTVQNGMYVLLWQISLENTPLMANKLLNVIQGFSTREVQIGYACYPADGDSMQNLLSHATQALKSAQVVGGSTIIPFSSPASKHERGVLAPWETLLSEAEHAKIPITTIFFKTSHPLSLSENYLIQKELRGRDMVTVFENGFYVFLWNTTGEGGQIVLAKLQQILSAENIDNQPVVALFPDDGKNLSDLLTSLDQKTPE